MLVYLCPLSVFVAFCLSVCPAVSIMQVEAAEVVSANTLTLTQCWANVGPSSTTLSQH